MQYNEVIEQVVDILREAEGKYLLPYQIFNRLKKKYSELGQRIENEYPAQPGHPTMGEGAGTPFSPASFIAQALNYFRNNPGYNSLEKRWFDPTDITIQEIVPGNKEAISIWAWNPRA